jgi:hypothetical protein
MLSIIEGNLCSFLPNTLANPWQEEKTAAKMLEDSNHVSTMQACPRTSLEDKDKQQDGYSSCLDNFVLRNDNPASLIMKPKIPLRLLKPYQKCSMRCWVMLSKNRAWYPSPWFKLRKRLRWRPSAKKLSQLITIRILHKRAAVVQSRTRTHKLMICVGKLRIS